MVFGRQRRMKQLEERLRAEADAARPELARSIAEKGLRPVLPFIRLFGFAKGLVLRAHEEIQALDQGHHHGGPDHE